jgi:hypothetical protein
MYAQEKETCLAIQRSNDKNHNSQSEMDHILNINHNKLVKTKK